MTRLLHVDDAANGLSVGAAIEQTLGWHVVTVQDPDDVRDVLGAHEAFDLAVVDLSFAQSTRNGLDALMAVHRCTPRCRLVVYTQGDLAVADMLRDAWEAFPLATALGKNMHIRDVLDALRQVLRDGSAPMDPFLLPRLPSTRSRWRSLEGYGELMQHVGHAKLWQALIDLPREPTYQELAAHTGLSLNTVRNYRGELLDRLALHHLHKPKMREMQEFAKRCRALLEPHIEARMSARADDGSPC